MMGFCDDRTKGNLMSNRETRTLFIFLLLLLALSISGCGFFGEPETVTEAWTGPGARDEQIVPTRPEEDGVHPMEDDNYVEHWYFDARLDNGYLVVGFLWASEMMTHKPGMELHIYRPSGEKVEVVKSYPESDLRVSEEKCDVWVGKNHAYAVYPEGGGLPVYHLFLSEGELEADLTFHSEIQGWKPGGGKTEYGDEGLFAWVVAVPRARVEGTIRIGEETIPAKGIGYHDHNWETADLKKVISHWYWGRVYTAGLHPPVCLCEDESEVRRSRLKASDVGLQRQSRLQHGGDEPEGQRPHLQRNGQQRVSSPPGDRGSGKIVFTIGGKGCYRCT